MEQKEWLKKELGKTGMGTMTAIFSNAIDLLEARIKWLKKAKAPASNIIELARDDMKDWRDELQLTEEDEF